MEGGSGKIDPQKEKTAEQIAEENLRAKYPNLVAHGPSILQKRLNRNVKYFDSGDYNMAKARCNSSLKAGMLKANPTSSAIPEIPADVIAAQQTGDTIPTPENVPAVRKKAVELQQEMRHQSQSIATTISAPTSGSTVVTTIHSIPQSPGSPTKPVAESHFTPTAEK